MTRQTLDAVFENGVFRVTSPLSVTIPDGQPVRLVVEIHDSPVDVLALATHVFDGLSEEEVASVERIAIDRGSFFRERATE
jgi:predicted DNA-binding antitoxin AbrB/MazE fold protein